MEYKRHFKNFVLRPTRATSNTIVAALNVGFGMALVFSAYGGTFDPGEVVVAAIMAMMFPWFIAAAMVLLLLDLVFWRKAAIVMALALAASVPPILSFAPFNFETRTLTPAEERRSFKFLTYNVLHFWDFRGNVPGLSRNATIEYILEQDADVVNLQEVEFIKSWPLWRITPEQIKELDARYPYRMVNVNYQLALLSKYPFEFVDLPMEENIKKRMACFRIFIGKDTVNLFNVHLESIGLTPRDKELYQDLFAKAPGSENALHRELDAVKTQLISKLAAAFKRRSDQARYIRHAIDSIGGNFIVAGDFNDIPACYAVRTILGDDMTDAYAQRGQGPTITYHGNKFYFRIDHVLYKGNFDAASIERGNSPASDHYPLLTTFVFDPAEANQDNTLKSK